MHRRDRARHQCTGMTNDAAGKPVRGAGGLRWIVAV